jgi:hypothetical protein
MVTPEIVAATPELMEKTSTVLLPLIARLDAPGPLIVTFVPIVSVLASVTVPVIPKLMVSPGLAVAIAFLREPGPLSLLVVTVMVLPKAGAAAKAVSNTNPIHAAL